MPRLFKEFSVATQETCEADWNGIPKGAGFFCAFCGTAFQPGDEYRAVYTNDMPGASGNPLCCRKCWDVAGGAEGLRPEWRARWEEFRTRFKWWDMRLQARE